jgi:hypothetical protein
MAIKRSGTVLRGVVTAAGLTLADSLSGLAQKPDNAVPAYAPLVDTERTCRNVMQAYPSPHLVVGIGAQTVICSNDQRYAAVYLPLRLEQWRWYQTHDGHRRIEPNEERDKR